MSKSLKINGLPTHGFPASKSSGDDGKRCLFSAKLYSDKLDADFLSSIKNPTDYEKIYNTDFTRFAMIEKYNGFQMNAGDDIYIPSEDGMCVFRLKMNNSNLYIDNKPYRVIDTSFHPSITYSFDNYILSEHIDSSSKSADSQVVVLYDFNISYSILKYIQVYVEGEDSYIEQYDDKGNSYKKIIEIKNDTDPIELRLKKDANSNNTTTIHIYGLYKVSENSFKRIYLGSHKIFAIPI